MVKRAEQEAPSPEAVLVKKKYHARKAAGIEPMRVLLTVEQKADLERIVAVHGRSAQLQTVGGALLAQAIKEFIARMPQLELPLAS